MSEPDNQQTQQQFNIELDEETAEGVYSNLVMISHSPEEFILDLIRVMPGVPKARAMPVSSGNHCELTALGVTSMITRSHDDIASRTVSIRFSSASFPML